MAFVAFGVLSIVYIVFAAMMGPSPLSDEGFETQGDMARFVFVSEQPEFPGSAFVKESGEPTQISDFKGRVTLVNLWATWCAPCLTEMPSLDRLQKKLGSDRFEVVAISLDKDAQKARDWLNTNTIENLAFYNDPTMKLHEEFGAAGLPTSYLVDASGRLVGYLEGDAAWDADDAEALIEHIVDTRS